jgi:hypothetical protein
MRLGSFSFIVSIRKEVRMIREEIICSGKAQTVMD